MSDKYLTEKANQSMRPSTERSQKKKWSDTQIHWRQPKQCPPAKTYQLPRIARKEEVEKVEESLFCVFIYLFIYLFKKN